METRNQNTLNLLYPAIFIAVLLILCIYILKRVNGALPTSISTFDLILVLLASFRFIRAVTYDKMFTGVREFLHYKKEIVIEAGQKRVVKKERTYGFLRTLYDLISCPWCTGIYTSIFAVFLYYVSPTTWIVILIFAIAGAASFIQLVINLIATHYELCDIDLDNRSQS